MTKPIYVLNGPMCRKAAGDSAIEFRQSNAEHQIVDWIHEAIE